MKIIKIVTNIKEEDNWYSEGELEKVEAIIRQHRIGHAITTSLT